MTATFNAVPPAANAAAGPSSSAKAGAAAERVPLEQFDSVFGSLI
ncbi:hypothetical protein JCM3774_006316, partial [Rhodotorula dairenensis]